MAGDTVLLSRLEGSTPALRFGGSPNSLSLHGPLSFIQFGQDVFIYIIDARFQDD